jgi:DNA-binding Xre family transcriptional regulator
MAVSYDKLWKLLVDKKMSRAELRKVADISSNTLTRMIKDEPVTLELLSRICNKLDCDFGDIVTYASDSKTKNSTIED